MIFLSSRTLNLFAALFGISVLAAAIYLECTQDLQACSLCILQRGVFILLIILLLSACLHNPKRRGIRIYGVFTVIIAVLGMCLAGRQIWLQSLSHAPAEICMPGFAYIMAHLPLNEALSAMMMGSDDCGVIDWTFLGWSIARWSFLGFSLFAVLGVYQVMRR